MNDSLLKVITPEKLKKLGFIEKEYIEGEYRTVDFELKNPKFTLTVDFLGDVFLVRNEYDAFPIKLEILSIGDLKTVITWMEDVPKKVEKGSTDVALKYLMAFIGIVGILYWIIEIIRFVKNWF